MNENGAERHKAALKRLSRLSLGSPTSGIANTHIHLPPNFSAFSSVAEAARQASEERIAILGASNYYDFTVYSRFIDACLDQNVIPLLGTEILALSEPDQRSDARINDPANPGKIYLCGKCLINFDSRRGRDTQAKIRELDDRRMAEMLARCSAFLNQFESINLPTYTNLCEEVAAALDLPVYSATLQERHLAAVLAEALKTRPTTLERIIGRPTLGLDSTTIESLLRSNLLKSGKPGYVEESPISISLCRDYVNELGGVLVYPVLADGSDPLTERERDPADLVEFLLDQGIKCVEFIPSRNRTSTLMRYLEVFVSNDFIVTAGTEHNTRDRTSLAPKCLDGPLPSDASAVFWRGACALVGRQHRQLTESLSTSFAALHNDFELGTQLVGGVGAHG